jgi:hypothetical protein
VFERVKARHRVIARRAREVPGGARQEWHKSVENESAIALLQEAKRSW